MTAEDWFKLIEQLGSIPGGAAKAEPDFFGHLITGELAPVTSEWDFDGWLLKDGRVLSLRLDEAQEGMRLFVVDPAEEHYIARTGNELLDCAREGGVSPLILMLLAIATGQVDDNKRLKLHAPAIDGAAKDLMLMSVCRLCG
ncbi:hypothetical protein EZJ19_02445 [Parasulfuritortus cantonensis]|uniref:Uncharacterized protein n=1 Tax=Parasulfuritortus cantonensis TaxID=2528202 RepID=A0A4R1BM55_9PROT|nr:hypothetical protein [Parasulfuritortus cantonensis]TCJ18388.1 hypothetical protein EZJ19_02445 [Parasulfuritortus cantonensis]